MPRSYKRKRQDPPVNLENMKKAVGAYLKKEGTLRQIAENFGIKKSTLLDYVRRSRPQTGEADKSVNEEPGPLQINFPTRPKHNRQVFESEHERKLADYFRTCSRMNHGLTTTEARKFAYSYARANNISVPENWCFNEAASKDWLLAFLKRNSDISVRKPEATSQARASGFNKTVVQTFFDKLLDVYGRFGAKLTADRIWNVDETGIVTVLPPPKVLAPTGQKQVGQTVSAERGQNVTAVCFASASGATIPPVFIFPRVNFIPRMTNEGPPGCLGLANPSGWVNGDLFLEAMRHFTKITKPDEETPILLLMDNHDSHLDVRVIEHCKQNHVTLLTFPPHCSHKLQPLDVGVLSPFKGALKERFNEWLQLHPGQRISIYEVASLSRVPFLEKFSASNIVSAFRAAGIFPFNRDVFPEGAFAPSFVTDRPLDQTTSSRSPSSQANSEAGPPISSFIRSPEEVRPFPRVGAVTVPGRGNRNRGRTRILTDTPEKEEIVAKKEKKAKPTPSTKKRKNSAVRKPNEDDGTDEAETLSEPVAPSDSSSDESLHCGDVEEDLEPFDIDQAQTDSYVLVKFKLGKSKKSDIFYVGQIKGKTGSDLEVLFLRRNGARFIFPDIEDKAFVSSNDIVLSLPSPTATGGTERTKRGLTFQCDLSSYNVR